MNTDELRKMAEDGKLCGDPCKVRNIDSGCHCTAVLTLLDEAKRLREHGAKTGELVADQAQTIGHLRAERDALRVDRDEWMRKSVLHSCQRDIAERRCDDWKSKAEETLSLLQERNDAYDALLDNVTPGLAVVEAARAWRRSPSTMTLCDIRASILLYEKAQKK